MINPYLTAPPWYSSIKLKPNPIVLSQYSPFAPQSYYRLPLPKSPSSNHNPTLPHNTHPLSRIIYGSCRHPTYYNFESIYHCPPLSCCPKNTSTSDTIFHRLVSRPTFLLIQVCLHLSLLLFTSDTVILIKLYYNTEKMIVSLL